MANTKISELTAAGSLTGSESVPIVQGSSTVKTTTQAIANLGGAGYLVYTALITQTEPDDPVMVVLQNTIGAIVVTRDSDGVFSATLVGAFPVNKTFCGSGILSQQDGYAYTVKRVSDDVVSIISGNLDDVPAGSLFASTPIEIRVYP